MLTTFLFWGCASTPTIPTAPPAEILILDTFMPIYGINEKAHVRNLRYIDTVSVAAAEGGFATNFELEQAWRREAGKIGANTITDVEVYKKNHADIGKFGTINRVKTIMRGKAVFNSVKNRCVNSDMLNALYHKHKNYKKPHEGSNLDPNDLLRGKFWLSSNEDLWCSFNVDEKKWRRNIPTVTPFTTVLEYDRIQELKRDMSTMDQYDVKKHDVVLSITQSEIDFFKKNFSINYRKYPNWVEAEK